MENKSNPYRCLYHYNLNCVLENEETGERVGAFQARECGQHATSSGFVAGGIASGGQSYTIATTDEIIKQANDMACTVYAEGIKYRLVGKQIRVLTLFQTYRSQPKIVEYVLVLE